MWNMALDDALLARARTTGETVLRVYSWKSPTLSLGRNQPATGRYDLDRARDLGVEIVRRPTGGRAVLHHREITYSVTAPTDSSDLRDSYDRINQLLLHALRALGANARLAHVRGRSPLPNNLPCFEVPTEGELTLDNRKLAGSAQWREDGAFLQHGSILVDDDQHLVRELSLDSLPPTPPAATLRAALGHAPSPEDFFEAISSAVASLEDAKSAILHVDDHLLRAAAAREAHYRSPQWTWRR